MAVHRINVATVSWISRSALSMYAMPIPTSLKAAEDEASNLWLYQLAFGMFHAANLDPPSTFSGTGYRKGVTLGQQYRGLTTCSLELKVDAGGRFEAVRSVPPIVPPDPGFTPPFDNKMLAAAGAEVQGWLKGDDVKRRILDEASSFHAGEASTLSTIAQPPSDHWQKGGTKPLAYGSLPVPQSETVLAHSLLKFRVAKGGDDLTIEAFGAPNHVPWVWCEVMLCYARDTLHLSCAGSMFPSHNYYLNGARRATIAQVSAFPDLRRVFTSGLATAVTQDSAAKAHVTVNQQAPRTEGTTSQIPVPRQPFTAPARQPVTIRVPLSQLVA